MTNANETQDVVDAIRDMAKNLCWSIEDMPAGQLPIINLPYLSIRTPVTADADADLMLFLVEDSIAVFLRRDGVSSRICNVKYGPTCIDSLRIVIQTMKPHYITPDEQWEDELKDLRSLLPEEAGHELIMASPREILWEGESGAMVTFLGEEEPQTIQLGELSQVITRVLCGGGMNNGI